MKVIILCGGEGTRLKEETEFKPKPMVEVGGRPILWHIMKLYAQHGFTEFILPLGYKGKMIKEYFLNWKSELSDFTLDTKTDEIKFHTNGHDNFKITFVETGLKSLTGERIRQVAQYITEDEFMVTYGDGVANIDLNKLVKFHHTQGTIGTLTGVHPSSRFGLIEKDEQTKKIKGFHQVTIVSLSRNKENIRDAKHVPSQDYINGGFMIFKKEFLDYLKPGSMIEESFVPLIEQGELSVYEHEGQWKAMDTYKDMEELNAYWQKDPFWKVW